MYTKGLMHMSFNSGEEILIIKGVHQNEFYDYFSGFKHLFCNNLIVYCSLHPDLVIWYVIWLFFGNSMIFF